jgi:hypothetical protein
MKRQQLYISLTLIALLFFAGCTERIDLELDSTDEKVVIEGEITTESKPHKVAVTKSAPYFANQAATPIEDAQVWLYEGENSWQLTEQEPGCYYTPELEGKPGATYQLEVLAEGTKYTAQSTMPQLTVIDSIRFQEDIFNDKDMEILLFAQEPGDTKDFYMWKYFKNHILETDTITEATIERDDLVNGSYISWIGVMQVENYSLNDTITLEMSSITEDYYWFLVEFFSETAWRGGPFDAPPANITGNISDGALGFFSTRSISRKTRIIEPTTISERR